MVVLKTIFVVLVLMGFVAGVMVMISGFRSFPSYYRWRRLLAERGVARFDWQSGMPHRFVEEFNLSRRLLSKRPEEDEAAESAHTEVRMHMFRAFRWALVFLVIWFVGLLVGLAARAVEPGESKQLAVISRVSYLIRCQVCQVLHCPVHDLTRLLPACFVMSPGRERYGRP